MKYTLISLLLMLQLSTQAQPFENYYIDTAGIKRYAQIEFLDGPHDYWHDLRICIADSGIPPRVVSSEAIREFNLYGDRYLSILLGSRHHFMRVLFDGKHLKRLLWEGHKTFVEYTVDGVLVPHALGDPKKAWLARVFAAYPLMSAMALHGELNDTGAEGALVMKAYEDWMGADPVRKQDTSLALRGMIDANQVRLPSTYFWREFGYGHLTGLIGVGIRQSKQQLPKFSDMPVYNPRMMQNPEYALGYGLRILARVAHLIRKGQVMGVLLRPIVFI